MLITILYIILCLLLIAFFSGIEIAFVSSSKLTFELKKKQGLYAGKVLSRFMEKPATFIGTSLVGINIVLVMYGLLMTEVTDTIFDSVGLPHNEFLRLFIDTIIATIVVLVLGEFIPKALFRAKPESTLTLLTLPIQFFYFFLYPLARLFVAISEFILKYLFNVRIAVEKTIYNRVDLEQVIKQMRTGQDSESQDLNTELFENALYLSQVKIRECLVQGEERPSMMSIGMHCRLLGRPGRLRALQRFLDHLQSHDRVWITRRIDIAQHWRATHPFDAATAFLWE